MTEVATERHIVRGNPERAQAIVNRFMVACAEETAIDTIIASQTILCEALIIASSNMPLALENLEAVISVMQKEIRQRLGH